MFYVFSLNSKSNVVLDGAGNEWDETSGAQRAFENVPYDIVCLKNRKA